jgi:hypothetical protein
MPIPLRIRPPAAREGTRGIGLNIPLGLAIGQGGTMLGQGRETQVLRAVGAAVALSDPARALALAKQAKETPETVINPALDLAHLLPVLQAVGRAQDDRSTAPAVSEQHQTVARAAGADPALVAAAHAVVDKNKDARDNGLNWVASIDAELLDRAARAGARDKQLDLVPNQTTRLERLEASVVSLTERVDKLTNGVVNLTQRVEDLEAARPIP